MTKRTFTGKVDAIYISTQPDSLASTRQAQVKVDFSGFEGDKHRGITRASDSRTPYYPRGTEIRNDRQVSIVSVEELQQIAEALNLPQIQPEWLGANLLLSGIPNLTALYPSTRLVFASGAVLRVEQENLPCRGPGKVIEQQTGRAGVTGLFPQAALHQRGLVASVEKPGWIVEGDLVSAEQPELLSPV
ncbi:MAG: hypothetical protein MUE67_01515 [Anaerolineales bacterium]|jgi:hypothetical protein|nr:hypothetical protein [Anaerolineales bacterium]